MKYSDWVNTVCALLEYQVVNAAAAAPTGTIFDTVIGAAVDYTENRIQRDLDFLASIITDSTGTMSANSRLVALPTSIGSYLVVSEIRPIVGGVKQSPLEPVSRAFLDYAWPSDASPGANIVPVQWAPYDQSNVLVGPAPDQNYGFEAVGTQRFPQMTYQNPSNFLTLNVPDLYVAASMVWLAGYQANYGTQGDDPQQAMSWEQTYQNLLKSAQVEEARKKYADMFPRATRPTGLTSQAA